MRIPITPMFSFAIAGLVTLVLRSIEAAEYRIGAVQVEITPEKGPPSSSRAI